MLNLLNENDLIAVKNAAFKRGLLAEDVTAIFAVYIRDKILSDKGMSIAEVDEHTPNASSPS